MVSCVYCGEKSIEGEFCCQSCGRPLPLSLSQTNLTPSNPLRVKH